MPKGTIIEHAAFCTSATEHGQAMFMGPTSRVFQFASFTFDASIMEILTTLIMGGTVCIPSDQDRMNDIPGAIRRMRVTWTLLTPSVASTLTPKSVPSLKVLVTGGEAMSPGHIAKWKGSLCLINAYGPSETSVIDIAITIQKIFARVLNIPIARIKLSHSFMSLGGDSISAMQVMAHCRKENLSFSLSEVLRSKSIHQLASNARFEGELVLHEEKVDQLFDLSPIQQLYFDLKSPKEDESGDYRFNQSFSLEITRKVDGEALGRSIERLVSDHSMLRARLAKSPSGTWQQRVTSEVKSSYRYRIHEIGSSKDIAAIVANSQTSMDIQRGPLFVVDLVNISGSGQMLFLAAHHLIIDMVSWRIILQDLEELLDKGTLSTNKPLSFQAWCAMQAGNSQSLESSKSSGMLPFAVPSPDLAYWEMDNQANTYGDAICETFSVSPSLTNLALGASNKVLHTEPVELFLSAITHSFNRVFVDRGPPPIHVETHGRESWEASIDISRTVGWFTSIYPIQVESDVEEDDVVDTVRRMKDARRSVPDNGRPYFAHRFLTSAGRSQFQDHSASMEILFNYLGQMQQLESDDSLFKQWGHVEDLQDGRSIADVGSKATRLALFEVSAAVVDDTIQFSFLYNRQQKHQPGIRRWIKECQTTLEEIAQKLSDIQSRTTFTLSDFPLLPISYDGLEKIFTKSLPQVGVAPEEVEDIYPCAPLQEGLLLSQIKDPSLYHFHAIFEVNPAYDGVPVDGKRLVEAFQKVVDRHGSLRTVFADSVYRGDIFNQIVVKKTDSGAVFLQCDDSDAFEKLGSISILDLNYKKQPRLPHQITVCETSSGKIYFKAEINHGVIDGGSANIMLRDLAEAYHGRLPDEPGPSYGDYVAYIKRNAGGAGAQFWKTYLDGARPCHFPILNTDATKERGLASVPMTFDRFTDLQKVCQKMKVTLANVMQAAWALCLRSYTKSEDVNFGVLTSGRDVPVNGIENSVGAFINMLVCRVKFDKHLTLKEMFQKVQDDYLQCLEHQHTSLAQVQHDLLSGDSLFNTAVSIQSDNATDGADRSSISFVPVQAHDPSEVRIDSVFFSPFMLINFQVRCYAQCSNCAK